MIRPRHEQTTVRAAINTNEWLCTCDRTAKKIFTHVRSDQIKPQRKELRGADSINKKNSFERIILIDDKLRSNSSSSDWVLLLKVETKAGICTVAPAATLPGNIQGYFFAGDFELVRRMFFLIEFIIHISALCETFVPFHLSIQYIEWVLGFNRVANIKYSVFGCRKFCNCSAGSCENLFLLPGK